MTFWLIVPLWWIKLQISMKDHTPHTGIVLCTDLFLFYPTTPYKGIILGVYQNAENFNHWSCEVLMFAWNATVDDYIKEANKNLSKFKATEASRWIYQGRFIILGISSRLQGQWQGVRDWKKKEGLCWFLFIKLELDDSNNC